LLPVRTLDDDGHALLRFADGQLRSVQTAVFGRHAVEVYVQPVGQLADGHADASRAEVVRLFNQARHFRPAEQTLQLAFFGGVALLPLAAALLKRLRIVLLRGARRPADTVAPRTTAQQQHDVARHGTLPADMLRLHRP